MTKQALAQVVQRAISDGAFRRQLSADPATALRGFDLTPEEAAAVRGGDSGRLAALGVDLRMSKAFAMGATDPTVDAGAINARISSDSSLGVVAAHSGGDEAPVTGAEIWDGGAGTNRADADTGGAQLQRADIDDGGTSLQGADVSDMSAADWDDADADSGAINFNRADATDTDGAGSGPGDPVSGDTIQP